MEGRIGQKKNGAYAIWYVTESKWGRWMIGLKDDLGENSCFIASPDDVVEPQQATTWKYVDSNDGKWKSASNNIIVSEILNGKTSIKVSIVGGLQLLDLIITEHKSHMTC